MASRDPTVYNVRTDTVYVVRRVMTLGVGSLGNRYRFL